MYMNYRNSNSQVNSLLNDIRYYNRIGKTYQSEKILESLIKMYPNDCSVQFEHAMFLFREGSIENIKESLNILTDLIESNSPNKNTCMYEFVKISIYSLIISNKIPYYLDILKNNNYKPEQVEYYYGKYYEKKRNFDEAIVHYKKSSDLGFNKASFAITKIDMKLHPSSRKKENIQNIDNTDISLDELYVKSKVLLAENRITEMYDLLKKSERLMKDKDVNLGNLYFIFTNYINISKIDAAKKIYLKYSDYFKEEWEKKYFEARINLCDGKYEEAKQKFNYVIKNGRDYRIDSYYFLAKIAYINDDIALEEKYYEDLINVEKYEMAKLYITEFYIRNNNYEMANKYFNSIDLYMLNANKSTIRQVNAMLGGELTDKDREFYTMRQIENYDIDEAVEHIMKHKEKSYDFGYFNEDVDIKELLTDVMIKIKNRKADYIDTFDHHILKYPNIGKYDNEYIDYVEVVSIPATNRVITMYPVLSDNVFAINYYNKKQPQKVLKRKSQIEKFNERYGKK